MQTQQTKEQETRPYTGGEIALTMNDVSIIVARLANEGFLVNKVVVGNAQRPTIFLFNNDKCREFFEYLGCRVVWSENLI